MAEVDTTLTIPISGMTCARCVARVEKALADAPHVRKVDVSLPRHSAHVEVENVERDIDGVLAAIIASGYAPGATKERLLRERASALMLEATATEGRLTGRRARWALAIAAVQMAVGMPLMLRAQHHMNAWIHGFLFAGTLAVVLVCRDFFVKAAAAIRHKSLDMNVLVALGSGTAFVYSTFVTVAGPRFFGPHPPDVHFEAASAILALVLVGRALETRARARTTAALDALLALAPAAARIVDGDKERRIAASELVPGQVMVLKPGERVAADGVVVSGESKVDASTLTGESARVRKGAGDTVAAGMLVVDGQLRVKVERTGDATQLARITSLVERAIATRAPVQHVADRVAAIFVPSIILVALVAAAAFWIFGPAPRSTYAITTFVAVVVVSCPCAMGLATPTALAAALGRGAEIGVLVRSGDALERAAEIDTVAIDKTGTLTAGEPTLLRFVLTGDATIAEDEALRLAASVEQASEHPIADAIVAAAEERGLALAEPTGFVATAGQGARATVDGRDVRVGAIGWLREEEDVSGELARASFGVMVDGALVAHGEVADALRDEARTVIERLKALDLRIVIVSGDRQAVAESVARELGIDEVHAELSPEGKLEVLDRLKKDGRRVAMCGDGVNDAPALAHAHVGVAMGSGTDAAVDAADVTLVARGLGALPDAVRLARRTMQVVRQNLAWAFGYNLVLVPIAAGVLYPSFGLLLPPVAASIAMALSSVSVVTSSLRLRSFQAL